MKRVRSWWVTLLSTLIAIAILLPPSSVHAQPACTVNADPRHFALRLEDFGRSESAYVARHDASYWNSQGLLFGFSRDDWTEMWGSPNGAYLYGGVVISRPDAVAGDYRSAIDGWLSEWKHSWKPKAPTIGDESVVYQRLTGWEIMPETPMVETFIAFRRCNVQAHVMFATMPHFDPTAQALRYARLIDERIPR